MPDEHEIIRLFRQKFGIGGAQWDDIERVSVGGASIAAKVDTLVYGTHVPPAMSLRDAARKSMVACVSDFAAKGIRPLHALVSVSMPAGYDTAQIRMIAEGLADASSEFGCPIAGGDTNRGTEMSITVCLLGMGRPAPRRSGARAGDAIFVSGPFGLAAAGLRMLTCGLDRTDEAVAAVIRPTVRLEFGIGVAGMLTASMDSSDGLSTALNEMAAQGGVSMVVTDEPVAEGLTEFAKRHGIDTDSMVYGGGEEYEIVFTAPCRNERGISSWAAKTGTPLMRIGTVEAGSGVYVERGGKRRPLPDTGWRAFGAS